MIDGSKCANCFEGISRNPVYQDGKVFCCDGCVIGGPCVCTYDGPPITLDTKDILKAAGYDLEALAAELSVCANCFEEFNREPVCAKEVAYCCQGCVRGGPCSCTYDDVGEDVSKLLYEAENEQPNSVNSDAVPELEMPVKSETPGYLNTNSLWEQVSQWDDITPQDEDEFEEQRVNDLWLLRPGPSGFWGPEEDRVQGFEGSVQLPSESAEPLIYDESDLDSEFPSAMQQKTYQVMASPLDEVADVRIFTSALNSAPSVESVILTHYSGDSATFEIDTRDLNKVIRELLEGDLYPVRSFSMSPEGLELTLRPKGLLATAARPEESFDAQTDEALESSRSSTSTGYEDVGAFKFEMGVDVFFNGRHQVEISGISGPVHMHSWRIQATLAGESVDEAGSLVGTQRIKDIITDYVSRFNEKMLNKVSPFDEVIPSSNNIARVIYDHVSSEIEGELVGQSSAIRAPVLKSIRLWESPTSYVEYSGDARAA